MVKKLLLAIPISISRIVIKEKIFPKNLLGQQYLPLRIPQNVHLVYSGKGGVVGTGCKILINYTDLSTVSGAVISIENGIFFVPKTKN